MSLDDIKKKTNSVFEEYGITYAAVFGSVARGEDTEKSDVDFLVRLGTPMGMFMYMRFIGGLEQSLGKKVDVVTENSVNKYVRPYVMRDLKTIYEK